MTRTRFPTKYTYTIVSGDTELNGYFESNDATESWRRIEAHLAQLKTGKTAFVTRYRVGRDKTSEHTRRYRLGEHGWKRLKYNGVEKGNW